MAQNRKFICQFRRELLADQLIN